MDYVSRVAASKVRHGHSDLLIVFGQVDADIFLQLLTATQPSEHRVFINHLAVELVVLWDLHTHAHAQKSALRSTHQLEHLEISL